MEKAFLGKYIARMPSAVGRVYTLLAVLMGWLLFVSENGAAGFSYLATMLGANSVMVSGGDLYELSRNAVLALVAVIGSTPLPKRLYARLCERRRSVRYATIPLCAFLLILCVAFMAGSSYNPFLYWNF